ncbi:DMT family transporter [Cohnella sp. 56]|uniref:DMT family transporter n=1 Tax=Cohnella sp. 56 TaxID=3113722 RepID=UPI0030E87740
MLLGLALAMFSGALVSLQNVFNSKLGAKTDIWVTTAIVLGLGFAASFGIGLALEGGRMFALQQMKTWYGFSGIVGVVIVVSMVQSIRRLGPTFAVSVMMVCQLVCALLMDSFGWLGLQRIGVSPTRMIGLLIVAAGIAVFKMDAGVLRLGKVKSVAPDPIGE